MSDHALFINKETKEVIGCKKIDEQNYLNRNMFDAFCPVCNAKGLIYQLPISGYDSRTGFFFRSDNHEPNCPENKKGVKTIVFSIGQFINLNYFFSKYDGPHEPRDPGDPGGGITREDPTTNNPEPPIYEERKMAINSINSVIQTVLNSNPNDVMNCGNPDTNGCTKTINDLLVTKYGRYNLNLNDYTGLKIVIGLRRYTPAFKFSIPKDQLLFVVLGTSNNPTFILLQFNNEDKRNAFLNEYSTQEKIRNNYIKILNNNNNSNSETNLENNAEDPEPYKEIALLCNFEKCHVKDIKTGRKYVAWKTPINSRNHVWIDETDIYFSKVNRKQR